MSDGDPPGREGVAFAHGNPGPMDDREGLIPAVAPLARAVATDPPGYGRADHPRAFDFAVGGYARSLGSVLARLGVDRAHLVPHDSGGPWGRRWAADHPARVGSVTPATCGVPEGSRWHGVARVWRTPVRGAGDADRDEVGGEDGPRRHEPAAAAGRLLRPRVGVQGPGARAGGARPVPGVEGRREAGPGPPGVATARPGCVLWGAGDPFIPAEFARKQKTHFPAAEVHVLRGLGHWPFLDDPEAVRAPLVDFLTRQIGQR